MGKICEKIKQKYGKTKRKSILFLSFFGVKNVFRSIMQKKKRLFVFLKKYKNRQILLEQKGLKSDKKKRQQANVDAQSKSNF